jgi:hypothetical protein
MLGRLNTAGAKARAIKVDSIAALKTLRHPKIKLARHQIQFKPTPFQSDSKIKTIDR